MRIPLPRMMRHWRKREFEKKLSPAPYRAGLGLWAFFAKRPVLYQRVTGLAMGLLGRFGRSKGRFRSLPLASGWTSVRDMPAPQGRTFQQLYRDKKGAA
jgi:L-lactate dehydrogenase complex protein LldF